MTDLAAPARRQRAPRRPEPTGPGRVQSRDDWRVMLVMAAFVAAFATVGSKMSATAMADPDGPRTGYASETQPLRAEITDRNGRLLAGNLPAWSLYAHPHEIRDPAGLAARLAPIFPDMEEAELAETLSSKNRFVWVKRPITPRQRELVHDLGHPALNFGRRPMRVYPAGAAAAHIVGSTRAAREGVQFTELEGAGGAEAFFDERLRDPGRSAEPLALSIDLGAQTALRQILANGMKRFTAKGAAGILMDVRSGEVLAMVSLPDFDPNLPPARFDGPAHMNPRFNRAALGRYELGSTFKPLTAAFALDAGVARPDSLIETKGPLVYGRQRIRDMHRMDPEMTVTDIIRRSSNVGAARLAMRLGNKRFRDYLDSMGFFGPSGIELAEGAEAQPLLPRKWTDLSTMTISFGHGLSASPLHLAAAYATLANGGRQVLPSLVRGGRGTGPQVLGGHAARDTLRMLRAVVTKGTAQRADVEGYQVAGKTGTADKVKPGGGYYNDRVIATFASVFPESNPAYVLVVTLDEPTNREGKYTSREASRTAVPLAGEAVARIAPMLGLAPIEPVIDTGQPGTALTRVAASSN